MSFLSLLILSNHKRSSNEISVDEISTLTLSTFPIKEALRCLKGKKKKFRRIRFWSLPIPENNIDFFPFYFLCSSHRNELTYFLWLERWVHTVFLSPSPGRIFSVLWFAFPVNLSLCFPSSSATSSHCQAQGSLRFIFLKS